MIVTLNGITIVGITTTKTDLRRAGHLVLHETAFTLEEPRWGANPRARLIAALDCLPSPYGVDDAAREEQIQISTGSLIRAGSVLFAIWNVQNETAPLKV